MHPASVVIVCLFFAPVVCTATSTEVCEDIPRAVRIDSNSTLGNSAKGIHGLYLVEHRSHEEMIAGRPTWWSVGMRLNRVSGSFVYFCAHDSRLYMIDNNCVRKTGKICTQTRFENLRIYARKESGADGTCQGWARTTKSGRSAKIEGPWQAAEHHFTRGFLLQVIHKIKWRPVNFSVSTSIIACPVLARTVSAWMQAASFKDFCLGGWGDARSEGLCRAGYLQHPRSLKCVNGTLNLLTPLASAETRSDKGWWCLRARGIGDVMQLDHLPPYYFIFVTGLLKLVLSLVAFGPPKPALAKETTTLLEKGKIAGKRCLQIGILAMAIGAFLSDMAEAWEFGTAFYAPQSLEGYTTRSPQWLARIIRGWGAVCLVLCNSGINSNIASITSLRALYQGHYQMAFAHEGARILKKRDQENKPVPVENRYGLKNAYDLAGHEHFDDDVNKLIFKHEGLVMKVYITFVDKISSVYVFPMLFFLFVGGVLYFWVIFPICLTVQWIAKKLSTWIVTRAEAKNLAKKKQHDATYTEMKHHEATYTEIPNNGPANLYEVDLPELDDDDAIFYLMMERDVTGEEHKSLTFTKDVSGLISKDADGKEPMASTNSDEQTSQSFQTGGIVDADTTLDYSVLCVDPATPEKRIKIKWNYCREQDKKTQLLRSGFVPVDAVVATFSREQARRMYAEEMRAYHHTGATTQAWASFFQPPLLTALLLSTTVSFGVRFVMAGWALPQEMVPHWGPQWVPALGGAYVHGLKTLKERTLAGFLRATMHSYSKKVELVNLVL